MTRLLLASSWILLKIETPFLHKTKKFHFDHEKIQNDDYCIFHGGRCPWGDFIFIPPSPLVYEEVKICLEQKVKKKSGGTFFYLFLKNKATFQDTHYHFQMIVVTWHTKWMNKMNLNLCCGCQSRGTLMLEFFCIVEEEKISKELLRKTFWKMGVHHHELWKSISCTHFIWRISRHRSISLVCVEFDIRGQFIQH